MNKYFVYFAKSLKNNKVYVGSTAKEPEQRVQEHNQNSNKFTRNNTPFKLIYYETYHCRIDAKRREGFYKSGFGKQIKKLIVSKLDS